jgi:hypothetical protein
MGGGANDNGGIGEKREKTENRSMLSLARFARSFIQAGMLARWLAQMEVKQQDRRRP